MNDEKHPCRGKLWSVKATECTGGYDAAFVDERGLHIRPRCEYFELCGQEFRVNQTGAQVPNYVQQYARPPMAQGYAAQPYAQPPKVPVAGGQPIQPMSVRPVMQQPGVPANYAYPNQPAHYQQPTNHYPQQPGHPYYGIQAPVVAPQVEMMPKNWFATPQVLGVHEPREERPWAALGVEIGRGMAMITGLVSADFFSNVRLLKKPGE